MTTPLAGDLVDAMDGGWGTEDVRLAGRRGRTAPEVLLDRAASDGVYADPTGTVDAEVAERPPPTK